MDTQCECVCVCVCCVRVCVCVCVLCACGGVARRTRRAMCSSSRRRRESIHSIPLQCDEDTANERTGSVPSGNLEELTSWPMHMNSPM